MCPCVVLERAGGFRLHYRQDNTSRSEKRVHSRSSARDNEPSALVSSRLFHLFVESGQIYEMSSVRDHHTVMCVRIQNQNNSLVSHTHSPRFPPFFMGLSRILVGVSSMRTSNLQKRHLLCECVTCVPVVCINTSATEIFVENPRARIANSGFLGRAWSKVKIMLPKPILSKFEISAFWPKIAPSEKVCHGGPRPKTPSFHFISILSNYIFSHARS